MPQLTPSQARVIDPILTSVARGYTSPKAAAADALFPVVPVAQRGGKIIQFGPDDFKLMGTAHAPGAGTKRIQFGYSAANFALVDYRLEGAAPVELMQEAQAVPGLDLSSLAVRRVQNVMALEREKASADIAVNAANYDNANKKTTWNTSGRKQWSDAAGSDPFSDVNEAKEAIRSKIGERPNTLVLAPKVLTALRSHPKVLERLSTASDRPPATLAQLQALFELGAIVEAAAVYHTGAAMADVWGTHAVLAYTTPASLQELGAPNYGYTYQLAGGLTVEEGYLERNTNTWYYPVTDARQPVLAGASAGYLFSGAVA